MTNALGALAVALAAQMDAGADAKGAAVIAGQLRLVLADIAKGESGRRQKDTLDEVNARRAARRTAAG